MNLMRTLLYSVVILLPLLLWHGTYYRAAIKDFYVQTAALVCFILLFIPLEKSSGKLACPFLGLASQPLRVGATFMVALLFLFTALVSLIFSPYRNFGVHNLPLLVTGIFLFYLTQVVIDRKSIHYLANLWLASCGLFSVYSILRHLKIISAPSLIGNRNFEAGYLILTIPLAISRLIFEYEKWRSFSGHRRNTEHRTQIAVVVYGFLVILFSVAVAITLSRGATIGIVTGLFVLTICYKISDKESIISKKFRIIFFSLVILIFTGILLLVPVLRRDCVDDMGTVGVRLCIWKGAMGLIRERPFTGWGWGTFMVSYGHYATPRRFSLDIPRHAHSEPLQVLAELGIPGFVVFLLLFYFFFLDGFRILKGIQEPYLRQVVAGFLSGIAGLLSHNLVSVNLRYSYSLIRMWIAMGAVMSSGTYIGRPMPPLRVRAGLPAPTKILSIILIVLSIFFLWKKFALDEFRSQYHLAMGMRYCASEKLGEKRFDKAIEEFDRAFLLNNSQYLAQWLKAEILEHRLEYRETLQCLLKFEKIFPEFGQLHGKLGSIYLKLGMEDSAIPEFEHAIKLSPYVLRYYISLGSIYFGKKMYSAALSAYNSAISAGLIHSVIYNNIGNIHFARNEFEKALSFYKLAHAVSPEDEGILYNLKQTETKGTNFVNE